MATAQSNTSAITNLPLTEWIRKGSDARSLFANAEQKLVGALKSDPQLDLTQLQLPFVQNILRRLSIAPKAKEWVLDPMLRLEVRNQLMIQHLVNESRIKFFNELIQEFWRECAHRQSAGITALLNHQMRSFHAIVLENNRIDNLLQKQDQALLKKWRDQQYDYINDIEKSLVKIGEIEAVLLSEVRDSFLDACENDGLLHSIFMPLSEEQRIQFNDSYVPQRIKLLVKIEDDALKAKELEETKQKIIERVRDFRDFAHDKKLVEIEQKIEVNNTKLEKHTRKQRELPIRVAQECGFDDKLCHHIRRELTSLNMTLDRVYGPKEPELKAVERQRMHLLDRRMIAQAEVLKLNKHIDKPTFTSIREDDLLVSKQNVASQAHRSKVNQYINKPKFKSFIEPETTENSVYNRLFANRIKPGKN